jgi:hypothetical protein
MELTVIVMDGDEVLEAWDVDVDGTTGDPSADAKAAVLTLGREL